jgi:hypothetical protein
MSAPALHVVLELEARPMVFVDAGNESEYLRLVEGLHADDTLQELLALLDELCGAR